MGFLVVAACVKHGLGFSELIRRDHNQPAGPVPAELVKGGTSAREVNHSDQPAYNI